MKLTVRLLDSTDGSSPLVLIEGSSETLTKLARVISSVAKAVDCGFEISPLGPGQAHFDNTSSHGLYVHRIPCDHNGSLDEAPPSTGA